MLLQPPFLALIRHRICNLRTTVPATDKTFQGPFHFVQSLIETNAAKNHISVHFASRFQENMARNAVVPAEVRVPGILSFWERRRSFGNHESHFGFVEERGNCRELEGFL
uniref:Uncharacterized protein n=1 Tax=Cucumis sativus TaxID=3659 RepID=A0A0A0KL48_CUCSA